MNDATPCSSVDAPRIHPEIRVELRSRPHLMASIRGLLECYATRLGFTEEAAGHLVLAVDEAIANCIRHGYAHRDDEQIRLSLWPLAAPLGIRIEIEDDQADFDPACIRSRDLREVRPGGLGVHLIRELTDRCDFERHPGGGMRLVIEKRCPPHDTPTPDRTSTP
jgi:anti-sigma regulatory factor (Ser/Thr protein kinase)